MKTESRKILFITTSNLATNPRLYKEVVLAKEKKIVFTVLQFKIGNWSDEKSNILAKELINGSENMNKIISLDIRRKHKPRWLFYSLCQFLARILSIIFKNSLLLHAIAHSKRSCQLLINNQNSNSKFDLIVAHNLGSLYPAYCLSKKNNIPFIFDIEDYHPGEAVGHGREDEIRRREFLFKKILPKAGFITYASPLIGEYSLKLIPEFPKEKSALINNCFSPSDFSFKDNHSEKISFVWFSQNITASRGLEMIVPLLYQHNTKVHLTLIGHLYKNFYDDFLVAYEEILTIIPPLSQNELHQQLGEFDIGLALELKNSDLNKKIALSNKIFAYAQSGLFILASDTEAQYRFIDNNPSTGMVVNLGSPDLSNTVEHLLNNIQEIRKRKKDRFDHAKKLSWDHESHKLMEIWAKL